MGHNKKAGLILLLAAALVWWQGACPSEAYTISLSPTYVEQRADVSALYGGAEIPPVISYSQPYAFAESGNQAGNPGGLWAYNGRGIESEVLRNHYLSEGGMSWSEAVIGFGGESGYNLPSSGFFLDTVSGNSVSRVSYALSMISFYGGPGEAETIFSIDSYVNNYPVKPGWDIWHSVTLKDQNSSTLLQWTGDLSQQSSPMTLKTDEIYNLIIESHGDFGDQVMFAGGASGSFLSLAELKIKVSEQVAIPAPDSLVLLVSALGGWLALRKRIALWR
jgi:hypothetical protein